VIGLVLVLQALQGLSDRETAEALTFDLRWKAACRYGLTDTAFHPSTLTSWQIRPNAWLHLRIAGLNLRRLLNLGLRDNNGTWAPA